MITTVIDLMASDAFIIQSQTHILVGFTVALFMLHAASVSQQCLIARLNISMHNSLGPLFLSLSPLLGAKVIVPILTNYLTTWTRIFPIYCLHLCTKKGSDRILQDNVSLSWLVDPVEFSFQFLVMCQVWLPTNVGFSTSPKLWVCSFSQPLPFRY